MPQQSLVQGARNTRLLFLYDVVLVPFVNTEGAAARGSGKLESSAAH